MGERRGGAGRAERGRAILPTFLYGQAACVDAPGSGETLWSKCVLLR